MCACVLYVCLYVCLYVSVYVSVCALCVYVWASEVCICVVNVSLGEGFQPLHCTGFGLVILWCSLLNVK